MSSLIGTNPILQVPVAIPSNFVNLAMSRGSIAAMKFVNSVDVISQEKDTGKISRHLWRQIFMNNPAPDPNTPEVWLKAGNEAKLDTNVLHEAIVKAESSEMKARLRAMSQEAFDHGAFGLPYIVVKTSEGPICLFGSDRVEQLAHIIGEKYYGPSP